MVLSQLAPFNHGRRTGAPGGALTPLDFEKFSKKCGVVIRQI